MMKIKFRAEYDAAGYLIYPTSTAASDYIGVETTEIAGEHWAIGIWKGGALPEGVTEVTDDPVQAMPVIPVLVSYSDPYIETQESVAISVKFLQPGSDVSTESVLTHFSATQPVNQAFHAPFLDSEGRLVFNQGFNIELGQASFSMQFPNPVIYYLRESKLNEMLEKRGLPFRVELYSKLPEEEITKGDVEFVVFQAEVTE